MGTIAIYLITTERFTMLLCALCIIWFVVMAVCHHIIRKKKLTYRWWRISGFVPFAVCIVHWCIFSLKGIMLLSLELYGPMYLAALGLALWAVFEKNDDGAKKHTAGIMPVLAGVIAIGGVFASLIIIDVVKMNVVIGNATRKDYAESLNVMTEEMREHYVMSDWKGINYEELEAEMLPYFEKAEGDPAGYYEALLRYTSEFHDGHIWVMPMTQAGAEASTEVEKRLAGNDYGFSLFTVDTGETIAVNVEEGSAAEAAGIHAGTVITRWGGDNIAEAIDNADLLLCSDAPVEANEKMVKPVYFAGTGGDRIDVSFLDEAGAEQTVTLTSTGNYYRRMNETLCMFYHMPYLDTDYMLSLDKEDRKAYLDSYLADNSNFRTAMISDDCGYIAVNSEENNTAEDTWASIVDDYPSMTALFDGKLEELREQGMKRLVIDLRNNGGGYPCVIQAIVSLFTTKDISLECNCALVDGEPVKMNRIVVRADGKWAALPVVVITNAQCASCGDGMTYAFMQCDNATVIGMTASQGIYQSIGGVCYMSNGDYGVFYPVIPTVDSDGNPMIDTGTDRKSRIGLDITIPVTYEAALRIFDDADYDYELDYALTCFR
ncbi:MAG: S41 family peptidase [Saccharofermentans sp.]|nr:S41 family peptidase [Saccharofermentans sp.]MCI1769437.1 S41 family peptidase [Mageeibacillus sp.]MCI2044422.1 S41 family peptidase [Mageeibacillus sp.]